MNEIYGVKSYPNIFVYTCFDLDTNKLKQFVVSQSKNQIPEMLEHLEKVENQIGFGNLKFDYYLLHHIIEAREYIRNMSEEAFLLMMKRIVESIKNESHEDVQKRYMSQLDLQTFFGFGSLENKVSLTDIKIAIGEVDVTKNEIRFGVQTGKESDILTEAVYDVRAITKLYYIAIGKNKSQNYDDINMISAKYKLCEEISINGINYPPTLFSKFYLLKLYQKFGGKDDFQNMVIKSKANETPINLKDCLPYYAMFSSKEFSDVVNHIINVSDSNKETFTYTTGFKGIPLKFGMGGLHGCSYPGRYCSTENTRIYDIDIVSMYATVATELNIKPRHLDDAFLDAMKDILSKRIFAISKNDPVSKGIVKITKSILNYTYGKTKESDSPFYDPKYSVKVVLCAQMFMAKFMEALSNRIPDIKFIMVNTDAITFMANKDCKDNIIDAINKMRNIFHNLRFKVKTYNTLYVRDINNYLGYNDNKITAKGIFDFNLDITKDNSFKIIPKVLRDILVYKEDIYSSMNKYNIEDFLGKAKGSSEFLVYGKYDTQGFVSSTIQNPSRYYYSYDYKSSGYLKTSFDSSAKKITEDTPITVLNDRSQDHPLVNKEFYIKKVREVLCDVNHDPSKSILF